VLDRALALGFDAVCTGHYARLGDSETGPGPSATLHRAADPAEDQSYVLAVLTGDQLSRAMFPLGGTPKDEVRREALKGLAKTDSKPEPRVLLDAIASIDEKRDNRER